MEIDLLSYGHRLTNSYLIVCTDSKEAMIVDPYFTKDESDNLLDKFNDMELDLRFIINTHGHPDHISGNHWLKYETKAQILIHAMDENFLTYPWKAWEDWDLSVARHCHRCRKPVIRYLKIQPNGDYAEIGCTKCGPVMQAYPSPPVDRYIKNEDTIAIGDFRFKVIHTAGHTQGSVSLYCREEGLVFTGDTLFAGSIGSVNSSVSSESELFKSLRVLMTLPNSTIVYPGHGEPTTIGAERDMVQSLLKG